MKNLPDEIDFDIDEIIYFMEKAGMKVRPCPPDREPGLYDRNGNRVEWPTFEELMGWTPDPNYHKEGSDVVTIPEELSISKDE